MLTSQTTTTTAVFVALLHFFIVNLIKKENQTGQDSQANASAAALCTGRPKVQFPFFNNEGRYWSVQPTTIELLERVIEWHYFGLLS